MCAGAALPLLGGLATLGATAMTMKASKAQTPAVESYQPVSSVVVDKPEAPVQEARIGVGDDDEAARKRRARMGRNALRIDRTGTAGAEKSGSGVVVPNR